MANKGKIMAVKKKVSTTKKSTVKKTTTKKKVATKKASTGKVTAITSKQTKTQILTEIAEETGLNRTQVAAVFSSLDGLIGRHMMKRGSGEVAIPNIGVKIRKVVKPRTKARMGRNPATGESIQIPAKPQRTVIKAVTLAALKAKVS
jgi:nucleoid DNA-binding protein